jgi:hypothetical protein
MFERFKVWLLKQLSTPETIASRANFTGSTSKNYHEEAQNVVPYDETLLAAAGQLQQGNSQVACQFIRLAQDWGCRKKLIAKYSFLVCTTALWCTKWFKFNQDVKK